MAIFPPAVGSVPGRGIDEFRAKLGVDLTILSITMSQSTGAYIEEVVENVDNGQDEEKDSHGEDQEQPQASSSSAPAPSGSKKKKNKKKSKVSKMLQPSGEVPQQLVNHVVQEVQAKHGAGAEGTDEASVRALLEQLKIYDVLKGKSGLGGKNRKDMGEHKVGLCELLRSFTSSPEVQTSVRTSRFLCGARYYIGCVVGDHRICMLLTITRSIALSIVVTCCATSIRLTCSLVLENSTGTADGGAPSGRGWIYRAFQTCKRGPAEPLPFAERF